MSYVIQRFPVTGEEIDRVVARFYARIRVHPILGPVFNGIIGTEAGLWVEHEAKIAGFWRAALLREPGYSGNPMQAHLERPEIQDAHFDHWLDLFAEVAHQELSPGPAEAWCGMTQRIARGFRIRMADADRATGAPPMLG